MSAILDKTFIYVFGGDTSATAAANDTWRFIFDGACPSWVQLPAPTDAPPMQAPYGSALDDMRDRILYQFGSVVWALDPDSATWTKLATVGNVIPPTSGAAFYDGNADRLLVFGNASAELDFAGSDQGVWQTIPATAPAADSFAATIDPTRAIVVVFGGNDFSGHPQAELARFDLVADTWSTIAQSGDVPSARTGAVLAYDANDKLLLLFGGSDAAGAKNDLYSLQLDGNGVNGKWTRISRPGTQPPARSGHAMTVDGDQLWLFGGSGACGFLDDLWTLPLDGGSWTNVEPQSAC
jgi:hypothetical protein